jgi:hypothetical protein
MTAMGLEPGSIRRTIAALSGLSVASAPADPGWGLTFSIAGWQYHDGEDVIETLRAGDTVLLIAEPDNRFDPNAIAVRSQEGVMLGYVPRRLAAEVGQWLRPADGAEIVEIRAAISPSERVQLRYRILDRQFDQNA